MDEQKLKDPVLPLGRPTIGSSGKTGEWRPNKRPKINLELCTKCYRCWQACPEVSINVNEEGWPEVDYDYCKGCMVCLFECPKDAITEEAE